MYRKYRILSYGLNFRALSNKIVLVMKLTLFVLFFSVLQVSARHAYAQRITVNLKGVGLTDVFKSIMKQTGYDFLYSPSDFEEYQQVNLNVRDKPFTDVLDMALQGKPFTYTIKNNIVLIEKRKLALSMQQLAIRGTVVDEQGLVIPSVSVRLKGGTVATKTDNKGHFSINVPNPEAILQFTAVGYITEELPVSSQESWRIVMKENIADLDEVVVVGYGTTTRRNIITSVDQVSASQLENRPVANVTQALQGAAPSLSIQQRSMNPNDNTMNINIRGISTMNSNAPLIVIDGLVSENGNLNKLNPADIESVSILKDAGSAAIYGSRSANGVILVTTKRGSKNQAPTIQLSGQLGMQDPKVLFRPVQGWQNATMRNLALTNVNASPQFTPEQIRDLSDHQSEESWYYDQILQNGLQQSYNVKVSGGSENTTYLFSGGYFDQASNFVGDGFGITRFNLRSNITTEYKRFKFTSILSYARNNSKATTAANAIINSSRIPPYYYYKMQDESGKYLINDALTDQNPLAELQNGGYQNSDNDYININLGLDYKILDGLKLRGVFGADIRSDHRFIRRIQVPLYANAEAEQPLVYVNSTRNTEDFNEKAYLLNYQLLLDYNKSFGKHSVNGLFGATNESSTSRRNEIRYLFTDPILGTPVTGTEISTDSYSSPSSTTETSINSLLGRAGYSYADKYFAEFNFRYDGSSRFAKQNRWGFFPSGSLAWRMSEESFMTSWKEHLGDLKLRGSYGVLGNQDIPAYQYLTVYAPANNSYGFNNTSVSGAGFTYGNQDLKWETTHTLNLGVDATFLDNALTASFDYFYKRTKDILITPEIPTVFGTTLSKTNAGEMENQGWELNLNYHLTTGAFYHTFGGNVGDSRNKVTKFVGDEQISTADRMSKIIRVGLPFNAYYGYKTAGYFQSMEEIETAALPVGISATDLRPGDIRYVDRNEDGVIDSKDRFVLGNAFPRYTFGFTYELRFKGFDFSMFWQGSGKRDMLVRGELVEPFHENYSYVIYQHQLDFWTPTNTDATWPRLTAAGATSTQNNYQMGSDLFQFSGSYIRLKNIQIGYTFPVGLTQKLGLKNLRAYVNAQNLLTFSKNSWIDPESSEFDSNMSGSANSARNYPTLRYYGFGFDVSF